MPNIDTRENILKFWKSLNTNRDKIYFKLKSKAIFRNRISCN